MTLILPEDFLVTKALYSLDTVLPPGSPIMHLKIVGGYALQVLGVRTDPGEVTDLDYIGQPLPLAFKEAVHEIGLQFGLGAGWLNNDVLLSGSTDVADIELSTGPLAFVPLDAERLDHFEVMVADPTSLLRMKLVAIDTQLVSYLDSRSRADFTRARDFADIHRICEHEQIPAAELKVFIDEMSDDGYLVEPGATSLAAEQARIGRSSTQILASLVGAPSPPHEAPANSLRREHGVAT